MATTKTYLDFSELAWASYGIGLSTVSNMLDFWIPSINFILKSLTDIVWEI